jgi:hypothetical protein
MGDDLKILKVEYTIFFLSESNFKLKLRRPKQSFQIPLVEVNLKIQKVEYLSSHLLDHIKILNLN